jgi:hypothetical protein
LVPVKIQLFQNMKCLQKTLNFYVFKLFFLVFLAILGLLLPRSPKHFLQTCMLVDLTIQWPHGGFMNKFSLVVEVRLIKDKIDLP